VRDQFGLPSFMPVLPKIPIISGCEFRAGLTPDKSGRY
jgi:hypothetical protein